MSDRRVFWNGDVYVLDFDQSERDVIASIPHQIRMMLADNDPDTYRMFPPAYMNDIVKQEEYRTYMGEELMKRHLSDLDVLEQTGSRDGLNDEELMAWIRAINQIRLVLGTRLDIDEETQVDDLSDDHPDVELFQLYFWLSAIQGDAIDALSRTVEDNPEDEIDL